MAPSVDYITDAPDYVDEAQINTPDIKRPKALGFLDGVQFGSAGKIKTEEKPISQEQAWSMLSAKQEKTSAENAYGFLNSDDELEVEIPKETVEKALNFSNMQALTQDDY